LVQLARTRPIKFIGLLLGLLAVYLVSGTDMFSRSAKGEAAAGAVQYVHVDAPTTVYLNKQFNAKIALIDQQGNPVAGRAYGNSGGQFDIPSDGLKLEGGGNARLSVDKAAVKEILNSGGQGTGVYVVPVTVLGWVDNQPGNTYTMEADYHGSANTDNAAAASYILRSTTTVNAEVPAKPGIVKYMPTETNVLTLKAPESKPGGATAEPVNNVVTFRVKLVGQARDSLTNSRRISGQGEEATVAKWLTPKVSDNTGATLDASVKSVKEVKKQVILKRGKKAEFATANYEIQVNIRTTPELAGRRAVVELPFQDKGLTHIASAVVNFASAGSEDKAPANIFLANPYLVENPKTPQVDPMSIMFWGIDGAGLYVEFDDQVDYPTAGNAMISLAGNHTVINGVRLETLIADPDLINIKAAEWFRGAIGADGSGTAMSAKDGVFNSDTEYVTYFLSSATIRALTEDLYVYYVHGQNALNNWGHGTEFGNVNQNVDTTIPTCDVTKPIANEYCANNNYRVEGDSNATTGAGHPTSMNSVAIFEEGTGDYTEVAFNDSGRGGVNYSKWYATWDTTFSAGQSYSFRGRALDSAGNLSAVSTVPVYVDNTKPRTNYSSPAVPVGWNNGATSSVSLTGDAYDVAAPVTGVKLFDHYVLEWASGHKLFGDETGWNTTRLTFATGHAGGTGEVTAGALGAWDISALAEGDYTLRLTSIDKAGNRNLDFSSYPTADQASNMNRIFVHVDNTPPTVGIDSPIGGWYAKTIWGTAADGSSGLTKVETLVQRLDTNNYWNGTAWVATQPTTWPQATTIAGTGTLTAAAGTILRINCVIKAGTTCLSMTDRNAIGGTWTGLGPYTLTADRTLTADITLSSTATIAGGSLLKTTSVIKTGSTCTSQFDRNAIGGTWTGSTLSADRTIGALPSPVGDTYLHLPLTMNWEYTVPDAAALPRNTNITVRARSFDAVKPTGQESAWATVSGLFDPDKPTSSVTQTPNGMNSWFMGSAPSLSITATDTSPGSGMNGGAVRYVWTTTSVGTVPAYNTTQLSYGASPVNINAPTGSADGNGVFATGTTQPMPNGRYRLWYYAKDVAKNTETWHYTDIKVDAQGPPVPGMTPESTYTHGTTNTVYGPLVTDNNQDNAACTYQVQRATDAGFTIGLITIPWFYNSTYLGNPYYYNAFYNLFTNMVDNQIYYYRAQSRDYAGNISAWGVSVNSRQDNAAPVINQNSGTVAPKTWYNTIIPVQIWLTDSASGPRGFRWAWEGDPASNWETMSVSGGTTGTTQIPGVGKRVLYVRGYDNMYTNNHQGYLEPYILRSGTLLKTGTTILSANDRNRLGGTWTGAGPYTLAADLTVAVNTNIESVVNFAAGSVIKASQLLRLGSESDNAADVTALGGSWSTASPYALLGDRTNVADRTLVGKLSQPTAHHSFTDTSLEFWYDPYPPYNWQSFSYPATYDGWAQTQTPSCTITIQDDIAVPSAISGLQVTAAKYAYSTNGGTNWSAWLAAGCTGSNGSQNVETITAANIPFNQDSPTLNKVKFQIADVAGSVVESAAYTVKVDGTPPTVTATVPGNDPNPNTPAPLVPPNTPLRATFSDDMLVSTVTNVSNFTLEMADPGLTNWSSVSLLSATYDTGTKTANVIPTTNLAPTKKYRMTVTTGVLDKAGNAMTSSYVWYFYVSDVRSQIDMPTANSKVYDNLPIHGLADGADAKFYKLQYGSGSSPGIWTTIGGNENGAAAPVTDGIFMQTDWSDGLSGGANPEVTTGTDTYKKYFSGANIDTTTAPGSVRIRQNENAGPWYDKDWAARKKITITNRNTGWNGGWLSNYQVKLTVPWTADMKTDFSDLRFTTANKFTLIDYWIESYTASVSATVWVEVPSIAAVNPTYIYLYYGNAAAASASSVANTFLNNQIYLKTFGTPTFSPYRPANHTEFDNFFPYLNQNGYGIFGSGYVDRVDQTTNPYGGSANYTSQYKFMFVPAIGGNYKWGTNSDAASEVLKNTEDADMHTTLIGWYGNHGQATQIDDHSAFYALTANTPVWLEYRQNNAASPQLAQMGIMVPGQAWKVVNTTNFPGQLFARNYAPVEPTATIADDNPFETTASLTSSVFDSGTSSTTWGMMAWGETLPAGTDVTVQIRTGSDTTPDDGGWSDWSYPRSVNWGDIIPSGLSPNRYIQYRFNLYSDSTGTRTPSISDIWIYDDELIKWNTSGVSDGLYTIRLLTSISNDPDLGVRWSTDNVLESRVTVTVENTTKPTSVITYPANGAYVKAANSISGTAADTFPGIGAVDLRIKRGTTDYWNGSGWTTNSNTWVTTVSRGSETSTWTYNAGGSMNIFAAGSTYTIESRATDKAGAVENTPYGSITVTGDNEAPAAAVAFPQTPEPNNFIAAPFIGVTGTATDTNFKDRKLEFQKNGDLGWTQIGSTRTSQPSNPSRTWTQTTDAEFNAGGTSGATVGNDSVKITRQVPTSNYPALVTQEGGSATTPTFTAAGNMTPGAGVVASDGKYVYVKRYSTYDGAVVFNKIGTGYGGTTAGTNYGELPGGIEPNTITAFYLDGYVYNGLTNDGTMIQRQNVQEGNSDYGKIDQIGLGSGRAALPLGAGNAWDSKGIVGGAIIKDGATYKMWYSGNDGVSWRIGYAISSDGITWEKSPANPVFNLGLGGSWDSLHVAYPTVTKDGATYKMWYSGHDGYRWKTGYATSTDGVTWTRHAANPVLTIGTTGDPDSSHASLPTVLIEGPTDYKMWYSGHNGTYWSICYATSTDGVSWTKQGRVMDKQGTGFEQSHVYIPTVLKDGSTYKMWYTGHDGTHTTIGYATSANATIWGGRTQVLNYPGGGAWDNYHAYAPSVIRESATDYKLWYSGNDGYRWNGIGFATSTNGTTWTKTSICQATNEKLVSRSAGTDLTTWTTDFLVTTDGRYVYSIGRSGTNWRVKTFDPRDGWKKIGDFTTALEEGMSSYDTIGLVADGCYLYAVEWAGEGNWSSPRGYGLYGYDTARVTRIGTGFNGTSAGEVLNQWYINQSMYMVTGQYDPVNQKVWMGSLKTGAMVFRYNAASSFGTAGTFTSGVFDAGSNVNWDTLARTFSGSGSIVINTRTGTTRTYSPDTWSSWQAVTGAGPNYTIQSPDGRRYIQYQVVFTGPGGTTAPSLDDISVTYSGGGDLLETWPITGLSDGQYRLRLTVTDNAGNVSVATSDPVYIDTQYPVAALNNLLNLDGNDTGFIAGNNVDLVGTATDTNMMSWVIEQKRDDAGTWTTLKASDASDITGTANSTGDFGKNWNTFSLVADNTRDAHAFSVRVRVTDKAGNTTLSTPEKLIYIDNKAPTITSTVPATGATNVNPSVTVTAYFDGFLYAPTVVDPNFYLTPSAAHSLVYQDQGAATYATFIPTLPLSRNTIYTGTLTTAIKSRAGKPMAANYNWNFTTSNVEAKVYQPAVNTHISGTCPVMGLADGATFGGYHLEYAAGRHDELYGGPWTQIGSNQAGTVSSQKNTQTDWSGTQNIGTVPFATTTTQWNLKDANVYTYSSSGGYAQLGNSNIKWLAPAWSTRKPITVANTGAAQTNFQVQMTVVNTSPMKADYSDLRFTDSEGQTQLNYWIEATRTSPTAQATVWVKIPNVPNGGKTIYMYYGNAGAATAQNPEGVFELFDDFTGPTTTLLSYADATHVTVADAVKAQISAGDWLLFDSEGWPHAPQSVKVQSVTDNAVVLVAPGLSVAHASGCTVVNPSKIDLNKWSLGGTQGFLQAGQKSLLKEVSTSGRMQSVQSFNYPIVVNNKTKVTYGPPNGLMLNGFYSSTSNGFGLMFYTSYDVNAVPNTRSSAQYYWNDGTWISLGGILSEDTWYKTSIEGRSQFRLKYYMYSLADPTAPTTVRSEVITNATAGEKVTLGTRYDNSSATEPMSASWDWVYVNKYATTPPTASFGTAESYQSTGTLTSVVFDGGAATNWQMLSWTENVPKGANITLQTRAGDVATPDGTWTAWSSASNYNGGTIIPAGQQGKRYIQYRTNFYGNGATLLDVTIWHTPLLTWDTTGISDGLYTLRLSVTDTPGDYSDARTQRKAVVVSVDNAAPTVTIDDPAANAYITNMRTVKGTATDSRSSVGKLETQIDAGNWQIAVGSSRTGEEGSWRETTMVDGCENAKTYDGFSGWNGNPVSVNSTTYLEGSGAMNLMKTNTTVSDVPYELILPASLNLTNKYLSLWLYVRDAAAMAKASQIQFWALDVNNAWSNYRNYAPSSLSVGWNLLILDVSNAPSWWNNPNPGARPDVSAVRKIRIDIDSVANATTWGAGEFVVDRWAMSPQAPSAALYTGAWTTATGIEPSDGSLKYSSTPNDSVTFSFTGTSVNLIGTRGPNRGVASVSIDGGAAVTVDMYAASETYQQIVFTQTDLTVASHTMTVTVQGTTNPASTGKRIDIDGFDVGGTINWSYDWVTNGLGDTPHTFKARATDRAGKLSAEGTKTYNTDNTDPTTAISSPVASGAFTSDQLVNGTSNDTNFDHYVLDYSYGAGAEDWLPVYSGTSAVVAGNLGTWTAPTQTPLYDWQTDGDSENWTPQQQITNVKVNNSILSGQTSGTDGFIKTPAKLTINGNEVKILKLRMKVSNASGIARLYWKYTFPYYTSYTTVSGINLPLGEQVPRTQESEWGVATGSGPSYFGSESRRQVNWPLQYAGQWVEYRINMGTGQIYAKPDGGSETLIQDYSLFWPTTGFWAGTIYQLRFDPTETSGVDFDIDYLSVQGADGNYSIRAKTFDRVGRSSTTSVYPVMIDRNNPACSVTYPVNMSFLTGSVITVQGTAVDDLVNGVASGIDRVEVRVIQNVDSFTPTIGPWQPVTVSNTPTIVAGSTIRLGTIMRVGTTCTNINDANAWAGSSWTGTGPYALAADYTTTANRVLTGTLSLSGRSVLKANTILKLNTTCTNQGVTNVVGGTWTGNGPYTLSADRTLTADFALPTCWTKAETLPAGWHGIQARTYDKAGNMQESNYSYMTVDNDPPPSPRVRAMPDKGRGGILLSWTPVKDPGSGVDYYIVYRNSSTTPVTDGVKYPDGATIVDAEPDTTTKNIDGVDQTFRKFHACNAIDTNFTANASVRYYVRAVDYAGNVSPASTISVVYDTQPPTTPSGLTVSRAGATLSSLISWMPSTDNQSIAEYRIYRATAPGFVITADKLIGTASVTGTFFTTKFYDKDLVENTTYYYKVVAYDDSLNPSSESNEASVAIGVRQDFSSELPHLTFTSSAPQCGLCHRAHAGLGENQITKPTEADMCFTCHDGTGSNTPTKAEFDYAPSGLHRVKDDLWPNGALSCIDCHNPHLNTEHAWNDNFDDDIRISNANPPDSWAFNGGTWSSTATPTLKDPGTGISPAGSMVSHNELRQSATTGSAFARRQTGINILGKGGYFATEVKFISGNEVYLTAAGDGTNAKRGLTLSIDKANGKLTLHNGAGKTYAQTNISVSDGVQYRLRMSIDADRLVKGSLYRVDKSPTPGPDVFSDTNIGQAASMVEASDYMGSWLEIGTTNAAADFDIVKVNNPGMLQTKYRTFSKSGNVSQYSVPDDRVESEAFCLSCHGTTADSPGGSHNQYYFSVHNQYMGGMNGQVMDEDSPSLVRADPVTISPRWQEIRDRWKEIKTNPLYQVGNGKSLGDLLAATDNGCLYCHGYHGQQFYSRSGGGEEQMCYECHGGIANYSRDGWNISRQYNGYIEDSHGAIDYFGVWTTVPGTQYGGDSVTRYDGPSANWYNSAWTKRQTITLTNTGAALSDYQVKLTIPYDSSMKTDFSDLLFTASDGLTARPFWIESYTTSLSAVVYVRLPAVGTSTSILMYSGNPSAVAASNGATTFDFWDDFNDGTIDTGKWTEVDNASNYITESGGVLNVSGGPTNWGTIGMYSVTNFARPFVFEVRYKHTGSNYNMVGIKDTGTGVSYTNLTYAAYPVYDGGGNRMQVYEKGAYTTETLYGLDASNWQNLGFKVRTTSGGVYQQSVTPNQPSTYYTSSNYGDSPQKIAFTNYNQAFQLDNTRVRKYAATEPTYIFGRKEFAGAATYNFDSDFTSVYAVTGPGTGQIDIYIDGVYQTRVNLASFAAGNSTLVYNKTGLTRGTRHTMDIIPVSASGSIQIDAVKGGGSKHGLTLLEATIKCTSCHGQRAMTDRHAYEGYPTSIITNPANIKQYWSDQRTQGKTINDYCNACHKEADRKGRVLIEMHTSSKVVPYTVRYPPMVTTPSANGFDRTGYTLGDAFINQENYTGVTYTPLANWQLITDDAFYGSQAATSTAALDQVEFTFQGSSVQWIPAYGPEGGIAQIFIDSLPITDGNTQLAGDPGTNMSGWNLNYPVQLRGDSVPNTTALRYQKTSLDPAMTHTMRIVNTGTTTGNPATDTNVYVDAFQYTVPRVGHFLYLAPAKTTTITGKTDSTHFTVADAAAGELAIGVQLTVDPSNSPHATQYVTVVSLAGNNVEVTPGLSSNHGIGCIIRTNNCAGTCHDGLPEYIRNSQEGRSKITCTTCHHPHATDNPRLVHQHEDYKDSIGTVHKGACLHCHDGSVTK